MMGFSRCSPKSESISQRILQASHWCVERFNADEPLLTAIQIRDYLEMLDALDDQLTQSLYFERNGLKAPGIHLMLRWVTNTPAGYKTFQNAKLNKQFKAIFDVWAEFLESPESCYVLDDAEDGWFGSRARELMPNFEATYICDPGAPYHGFASWDDFFTRRLRPGVRPVECANDNLTINSPCESGVLRIATGVKAVDSFWLKGQPYSLNNMLDNDPLASKFVGGTVYQAHLAVTNYHRWHSPVNGTIEKIVSVPGTYFVASITEGFDTPFGPDYIPPEASQAFLSAVATRMLIYIQADEPSIGLLCFIPVGMGDISSCKATVRKGDRVKKGDQLGSFHYGGSTMCLVFRPETKIQFGVKEDSAVPLSSAIATVRR